MATLKRECIPHSDTTFMMCYFSLFFLVYEGWPHIERVGGDGEILQVSLFFSSAYKVLIVLYFTVSLKECSMGTP